MSDGLEIRSGGAVHVDTESLRAARDAAAATAARARVVRERLDRAVRLISSVAAPGSGHAAQWSPAAALTYAALTAERLAVRLETLADDLGGAADLYELVELEVKWKLARAAGSDAEVAALERRVVELGVERWGWVGGLHPQLAFLRLRLERARQVEWADLDLATQASYGGLLFGGPLGSATAAGATASLLAGAQMLSTWRRGRAVGEPLLASPRGGAQTRAKIEVVRTRPASPPDGLAAAAARVPGGGRARVRVERYELPDGSREWMLYVTGTQTFGGLPAERAGSDPFDMASNARLYTGAPSASYDAVVQAARDAGVRPGEPVHTIAHSQGALITHALAASGEVDVQTVVTFGSPAASATAADVLSIDVRHTDDVVAALSGSLRDEPVGAAGSLIVQRLADPLPGMHDVGLPAHHLESYIETAHLIDASADPRGAALGGLWARLRTADRVTATEYSATRAGISPPAGDAG